MTIATIPDAALALDSLFESREAVEASLDVAPGSNFIRVMEAGRRVVYKRTLGATELIGGDGSTWLRVNVTIDDLTSLAADFVTALNAIPTATGVWTPGLAWSGGGGSFTADTAEGIWYRCGQILELRANLSVTINSGGSGNLQLTGLPLATRAGSFASTLDVNFDTTAFQTPYGGTGWKVRIAGGQKVGPVTFDAGSNFAAYYVTGLTGTPIGNGSVVALGSTGDTAQIRGFEPHPTVANAGMVSLVNRYAEVTEGMTLTGSGWTGTATLSPNTWFGAAAGTSFLNTAQVKRGKLISLEIGGRVLL